MSCGRLSAGVGWGRRGGGRQFQYLQTQMVADSTKNYALWTSTTTDTSGPKGVPIESSKVCAAWAIPANRPFIGQSSPHATLPSSHPSLRHLDTPLARPSLHTPFVRPSLATSTLPSSALPSTLP